MITAYDRHEMVLLAIEVNSVSVSSSPDAAAKEVEVLERSEALKFAEEVLVTPQCE
ncbi:hypothetical protein A2U01_0036595, partial [Trifolium medium]|nr:hypothetical protein [Trifolium medium]